MLFPEQKDANGIDYRENLVTVPACKAHNQDMGPDDIYFSLVMSVHFKADSPGQQNFGTKILRAIQRDPGLSAQAFKNLRPAIMDGEQTGAFTVDRDRFDRCVRKITAGMYHRATGFRLPDWSIMNVLSPDLRLSTLEAPHAALEPAFADRPGWSFIQSGHSDIYRCRYVVASKRPRHFAFEHVFLDGFRIWVIAGSPDALWVA